jgi:transcriptional regulator of arginine metabolism
MVSIYTNNESLTSKTERQAELLKIVGSNVVKTQTQLSALLKKADISCTQVSVSRDIRELGLVKRDGQYVVPEDQAETPSLKALQEAVRGFIRQAETVGDNMVVVKTLPATAHSIALFVDRLDWQGLKGTIAGDDTVFVAVKDKNTGKQVAQRLRKLMKE